MNPRDFIHLNISTDGEVQEECNNILIQDDKSGVEGNTLIGRRGEEFCNHRASNTGISTSANLDTRNKCTSSSTLHRSDSENCGMNGNAHRCISSKKNTSTRSLMDTEQTGTQPRKHLHSSQGQQFAPQCCMHGEFGSRPSSTVRKRECQSSRHPHCNSESYSAHGNNQRICRKARFMGNCMASLTCSSHCCESENENREQLGSHCKNGIKRRRCCEDHTWPSSPCPNELTIRSSKAPRQIEKKTQGTQTPVYEYSEHDYSKTMEASTDMSVDSTSEAGKENWECNVLQTNAVEVTMDSNSSIEEQHVKRECTSRRTNTVDTYLQNVLRRDNTACNHLDEGETDEYESSNITDECESGYFCDHRKIRGERDCSDSFHHCSHDTHPMQQFGHCRSRAFKYIPLDDCSDSECDCSNRHCRVSRAECNEIYCTSKHNRMCKASLHQSCSCSNDNFHENFSRNTRHVHGCGKMPLQSCSCHKNYDSKLESNRIVPSESSRNDRHRECHFDGDTVRKARLRENVERGCGSSSTPIAHQSTSFLSNTEKSTASIPTCSGNDQTKNELPENCSRPGHEPKKANQKELPKLSIFDKIAKWRCSLLHEKDPLSLDDSTSSSSVGELNDGSKRETRAQKNGKPFTQNDSNDDNDYDDDDEEEDDDDEEKKRHDARRKATNRKLPKFQTPFRSKRARKTGKRVFANSGKQSKKKTKQPLPLRLEMLLDMPPVPHEVQLNNSWNPDDSSTNMKVVDGNPLICKRDPVAQSTDCIRCRVGYQQGIHLFEIKWPTKERGTHASIGVSTIEAPIHKEGYFSLVGDNEHSWGWELMKRITYHRAQNTQDNDGEYPIKELQKSFAQLDFNAETVVTIPETFKMVLNMEAGTLGFMNGDLYLGHAFTGLKGKRLFPMVSAVWGHCEITLRYLGGIDAGPLSLMDLSRHQIRREIDKKQLTAQNLRRLGLPNTLHNFLVFG